MKDFQRVLDIPGGFNFRELGNYKTVDNRTIQTHRLIRAGYLNSLTHDGIKCLQNLEVHTIIDLRSASEVSKFPDVSLGDARYYRIPIFENDETGSEISLDEVYRMYAKDENCGCERMLRSYRMLATNDFARQAYQAFFAQLLAAKGTGAILFHCSAGKDRTGMCAILLLAALGVDIATIKRDYLLTNEASKARISWRLSEARKLQLGSKFVKSIKDLASVKEDYFDQLMGLIDYEFGGLQAFIRDEVHLSSGDISDLKGLYLH